ncbi:hypothetical protein RQP46_002881 [Phenoliferia psychrophenolica]
MWRPLSLILVGLSALSSASAADVATDWHLPHVGAPSLDPTTALPPLNRFYSISTQTEGRRRSLALTLTDKDVLAALDPASGAVVWRQQYSLEERPEGYYACGETLTVLSAKGASSLSSRSGAVRWTSESEGVDQAGGVDAICWDAATADVVTLVNGEVRSVAGVTGKVAWTWRKASDEQHLLRLARISDSQLAVILQDGPSLTAQILYISTGQPLSSISIKASPENGALAVVPSKDGVWGPTLVWLSGGKLQSTLYGVSFSPIATFSDAAAFLEILDVGLRDKGIFVAKRVDGSAVVFSAETGTVKPLWKFHEATANSFYSGFVDRDGYEHVALLTFSKSLGLGNLQVLSLRPTPASPTGLVTGHTFPFKPSESGFFRTVKLSLQTHPTLTTKILLLLQFCIEVVPQSEYVVATRTIIGTDLGSMQLWTGTKLSWASEEGLASIDVRPVFVAPPERAHLGDLPEAHSGFSERLERQLTSLQQRFSAPAKAAVVPGLHEELIVLASSTYRSIYALDAAQDGSLKWRTSPPLAPGSSIKWLRIQVVDGEDSKQAIAATAEVTLDGAKTTTVFQFDAVSGALVSEQLYDGISSSVAGIPQSITTVELRDQRLVGLKPIEGRPETIWTFAPPPGEKLVLVVPQHLGAVASLGRVLGNRSTLLKYLNPHLAATVTLHDSMRTAIVYVIDTASGSLVHKLNLVGEVEGDVHLVLQDNWIVVTYKVAGDPARSTRVVSVELYQPEKVPGTIASSLRSQTEGVRVLSRSFTSTIELNVVGVTRTQLGITTYNAIFTNGMGQVVVIPRRVLDPRRTFEKPTKDDQEEMLMPYDAVIPIHAQWTASHTYELFGVTHVVSAPGRRESESLVLGFGHDLFFTRQSPSKSFDVLSPAFNKFQLVITVSILSVALVVTRSMVQSRRVKQKCHGHSHSHEHAHHEHPHENGRADRQRQPKVATSRRARFQAGSTLLPGSSLAASASPFVPPSASSQPLTPAPGAGASPASQTLLARLTAELTSATYDCAICFAALSRTAQIHSCSTCYTSFHLGCITKWATRSVDESSERAQLLATRNPQANQSRKDLEGSWRCPGCQTSFTPAEIPSSYRCFCLRVKDPPHRPPATPHSISCHPGPCPPCSIVLDLACHCTKHRISVRCSAIHGGPATQLARSALLSCREPCDKLRGCGLHRCADECHEGPCQPCEEVREKKCFCGKSSVVEGCGAGARDDRVECFKPGQDDQWTGEWSCVKACQAPYDCGNHLCELSCHPHTSSSPLPCPFSPTATTHCPCGSTPLSILLATPRTSCLSPIPTCPARCGSVHPSCGHSCPKTCHAGECGPCAETVSIVCRCGSTKATRRCGDVVPGADELLCERVCRAMRSCGRHACGRKCCPLAYQEALLAKAKSKRRPLAEMYDMEGENDPMGIHLCERVCGRKLSSTVLLPPIACNTTIDCRHPCIRESTCGHPQMAHACHEDAACPPCPFLMEKSCACGKKRVGNVRCSQDPKRVSCGTPCGKLLRCAFHRCRKTCHAADDGCEGCDQVCLKPRRLCGHPCAENCHFPSTCAVDEAHPCPKLIDVTCSCGHLKQRARCATSTAKPEGNRERLIKCTDACVVAKRNTALADALGIEKKEPKVKEVEYDPLTLAYFSANVTWCTAMQASLTEFTLSDKPSLHLPVMKRPQRQFVHELAELFELRAESLDEEPHRSIVVHRQSNSGIPVPTLQDALALQRKNASSLLTFGSLRKALPERQLNNAMLLDGVLGFDESMLNDILRPHMRSLPFDLTWVTEEDVLISFSSPATASLDAKLASIQNALRLLTEETGFCAAVEAVHHADDGKITRGSWTPVAGASRSATFRGGITSSPNAFAALGGGSGGGESSRTAAVPRIAHAWGGVVGPSYNKPPQAVIGSVSSQERPPPPPVPRVATPVAPPEPVERSAPIPDDWEEE